MRVETDFLILGSGIAGLSFALKASQLGRVTIITKSHLQEGATRYAQGGIASVFSKEDSFEHHINDTHTAGAGLCHSDIVELTVREGPDRVRELIELGVAFTKSTQTDDFPYDLTREGGHCQRRILHSDDFTGKAIEDALIASIRQNPQIQVFENHIAIDLITNVSRAKARTKNPSMFKMPERKRCLGVYVLDRTKQEIHTFSAPITVLATGGAGKVYLYTTNPDTATGDGIAMAYRAGARIANMEFMQFHPTCLYHPKAKSFLISEALRGEGGILVDAKGHAFMKNYHEQAELAPRDIVARAIDSEIKRTGAECMFLDMTKHAPDFLKTRFPNIYENCLKFSIDLTREPIPIIPAAHYTCGGVLTDEHAETTIENLFAIGETASTGLHGANRLASNSLLEGVVFAHRAYEKIKARVRENPKSLRKEGKMPEPLPEWDSGLAVPMEERINIHHTWKEIRMLMWNYVGIVRTNRRLEKAQSRIELIHHEVQEYYWNYLLTADLIELRNIVSIAELVIQSALMRKESRGLHYNLDYPHKDDRFFKRDSLI